MKDRVFTARGAVGGSRTHMRPDVLQYLVAGLCLMSPLSVQAQSSWDAYRPGSIRQVVALQDSSIRATPRNELPTWITPGNQFPTRAVMTYTGESRPIDRTRRQIIRLWALSFRRDSSIPELFSREFRFKEGQREFWLPVQDSVATYFPRELQPGRAVTVYVTWLGAYYAGGDITWAFVVNEFDADTTAR